MIWSVFGRMEKPCQLISYKMMPPEQGGFLLSASIRKTQVLRNVSVKKLTSLGQTQVLCPLCN